MITVGSYELGKKKLGKERKKVKLMEKSCFRNPELHQH
jgi:hypothetical protein